MEFTFVILGDCNVALLRNAAPGGIRMYQVYIDNTGGVNGSVYLDSTGYYYIKSLPAWVEVGVV